MRFNFGLLLEMSVHFGRSSLQLDFWNFTTLIVPTFPEILRPLSSIFFFFIKTLVLVLPTSTFLFSYGTSILMWVVVVYPHRSLIYVIIPHIRYPSFFPERAFNIMISVLQLLSSPPILFLSPEILSDTANIEIIRLFLWHLRNYVANIRTLSSSPCHDLIISNVFVSERFSRLASNIFSCTPSPTSPTLAAIIGTYEYFFSRSSISFRSI